MYKRQHPIVVTVSFSEYVGTDAQGNINRMWKNKPRTMLRKVALMQGLREAFPTTLGGLYEENELDQQEIPIMPESHTTNTKPLTPKPEPATQAQLNLIEKQILGSHLIIEKEKGRLEKKISEIITKKEASEIISWWLGDKQKGLSLIHI